MKLTRIYINFDLDTVELRKLFKDKKSYTTAYTAIRNFLEKNGFVHNQGSGYVSEQPMTFVKASTIVTALSKQYPWLHLVNNGCKATQVAEKDFDLTKSLNKPYLQLNTKARKPSQTPEKHSSILTQGRSPEK